MPQPDVPIDYFVSCVDPDFAIAYPSVIPHALTLPNASKVLTASTCQAIGESFTPLILRARSWTCHSCNKTAGELFHQIEPYFYFPNGPPIDPRDGRQLKPILNDVVVPICKSGSQCEIEAQKKSDGANTRGAPRLDLGVCKLCSKSGEVKACSACKTVRYCSKNCQKRDWGMHKLHCKRV